MRIRLFVILGLMLSLQMAVGAESTDNSKEDGASVSSQEVSLEDQLDSLAVPDNMAPGVSAPEQVYSVQTRYMPLKYRHEISLIGGRNFTPEDFLSTNQVGLSYRFHISDRWSVALTGEKVFNEYSAAAKNLYDKQELLPDVDFAKLKYDVSAAFNVFYGKFRLSMTQVFYFDQYISLGVGQAQLSSGNSLMLTGGVGLALWIGKLWSIRLGVKDQFFKRTRVFSTGQSHNFVGHLDLGIVL